MPEKHQAALIDLLIENGRVITVDGDRFVAVGTTAELRARYTARKTINGLRKVGTVDEAELMEWDQLATDRMLERAGLAHLRDAPEKLWRSGHY